MNQTTKGKQENENDPEPISVLKAVKYILKHPSDNNNDDYIKKTINKLKAQNKN